MSVNPLLQRAISCIFYAASRQIVTRFSRLLFLTFATQPSVKVSLLTPLLWRLYLVSPPLLNKRACNYFILSCGKVYNIILFRSPFS